MRQTALLCVVLSATLVSLGCGQSGPPPGTDAERADAKRRSEGAAADRAATTEVKDQFANEMRKELEAYDKKYADMERRAATADGAAKKDLQKKVEDTKSKRDEAMRKLNALRGAGTDHWPKAKEEMVNALAELKKAFE